MLCIIKYNVHFREQEKKDSKNSTKLDNHLQQGGVLPEKGDKVKLKSSCQGAHHIGDDQVHVPDHKPIEDPEEGGDGPKGDEQPGGEEEGIPDPQDLPLNKEKRMAAEGKREQERENLKVNPGRTQEKEVWGVSTSRKRGDRYHRAYDRQQNVPRKSSRCSPSSNSTEKSTRITHVTATRTCFRRVVLSRERT